MLLLLLLMLLLLMMIVVITAAVVVDTVVAVAAAVDALGRLRDASNKSAETQDAGKQQFFCCDISLIKLLPIQLNCFHFR